MPISETINVPFDFHRNLIGKGGSGIRRLMEDYSVSINIPAQDLHSDEIVISGSPANVKEAVSAIMAKVDQYEEQEKQRVSLQLSKFFRFARSLFLFFQQLKSFKVTVQVPPEYHPKLIGPKGRDINRLREKYDVQISIPAPSDDKSDEITITGKATFLYDVCRIARWHAILFQGSKTRLTNARKKYNV